VNTDSLTTRVAQIKKSQQVTITEADRASIGSRTSTLESAAAVNSQDWDRVLRESNNPKTVADRRLYQYSAAVLTFGTQGLGRFDSIRWVKLVLSLCLTSWRGV
jgi:hypothetical protein